MILKPPKIIDPKENKVIFLAGPIQGALDWQEKLTAKITEQKISNICIANPRRVYMNDEFIYEDQVNWESHYLQKASENGIIVFWLAKENDIIPGRAYAQTTRFEIGEWFGKKVIDPNIKIVIGGDPSFSGTKYIKYKFKKNNKNMKFNQSLDDVVYEIATILK